MNFGNDKLMLEVSSGIPEAIWYSMTRMLVCAQLYEKRKFNIDDDYLQFVSARLSELNDNFYEN